MNALNAFRLEVAQLMLHFFITICILGGYLYTIAIGHPDETLKNLLILIGGYWFGVLSKNAITNTIGTKKPDSPTDETK